MTTVPGKPDLAFTRQKVCVFVDGDFWHGRNWDNLVTQLQRRANPGYWIPKIAANMQRDRLNTNALQAAGWQVVRIWETDVLADPGRAADSVMAQLQAR
jgi:DNA mismatch endonuclease (patch repair protein)